MGVAEEHRAGAEEVVEVASAVHVPEVGAAAFLHDELEAGAAPVIAEQATRERVRGASQEVVLISHEERTSLRPAADCATGLGGTEPRRTHGHATHGALRPRGARSNIDRPRGARSNGAAIILENPPRSRALQSPQTRPPWGAGAARSPPPAGRSSSWR